jgi:hypothetical protein
MRKITILKKFHTLKTKYFQNIMKKPFQFFWNGFKYH